MRHATIIAATAVLAALAACTPRQVDSTPPTVTYSFESRSDYDDVARQAERYCGERYGLRAFRVERQQVSGGYEAVFACE